MRILALLACTALLVAGYGASAARGDDAEALTMAKREAQQATARFQDLDRRARRATNAAARARAEGEALAARIEAAEADLTAAERPIPILSPPPAPQRTPLA